MLVSGDAKSSSGSVTVSTANATASSGSVSVLTGSATSSSGDISVATSDSGQESGGISIASGDSGDGVGGSVEIRAGASSMQGGQVLVSSGAGDDGASAGGVILRGGHAAGSGAGGDVLIKGGTSVMGTGGSICIFSGESEFSTSGGLYVSRRMLAKMVPAEVCTCGLALRHHKAPGQFCLARELRRKAPRAPFRSWAETVMRPVAPFQFQAATRPMLMAQGEISGLHLEVALERQGRYSLVRHTTQMATPGIWASLLGPVCLVTRDASPLQLDPLVMDLLAILSSGLVAVKWGGGFFISAGTTMGGDACGGSIEIAGGDSSCGAGGPVTISAGSGLEHAGDINFYGGRWGWRRWYIHRRR